MGVTSRGDVSLAIYDKLLRVLATFKSRTRVLSDMEEWLMLLEPYVQHLTKV